MRLFMQLEREAPNLAITLKREIVLEGEYRSQETESSSQSGAVFFPHRTFLA